MNSTIYGNPEYYRVVFSYRLSKSIAKTPRDITILCFTNEDLSDPSADLVCVYHYAGIRRYLWNDDNWSEYPVNWRLIREYAVNQLVLCNVESEINKYTCLLNIADNYGHLSVPNVGDNLDSSGFKIFARAIYKI